MVAFKVGIVLIFTFLSGETFASRENVTRSDEIFDLIDDVYKLEVDPQEILFVYFNSNGEVLARGPITNDADPQVTNCAPGGKVAFVLHGWMGSCDNEWVITLMKNFGFFRGGCLICMDYSRYAKAENYIKLYRTFVPLRDLLVLKLNAMISKGFQPDRMFFYGFSFGARLALEAGKMCGDQIFEGMDICEPAGPGFDSTRRRPQCDERSAAKNVQIIHTSMKRYGTRCSTGGHQNFRLGNCGWNQEASAHDPQTRSHGYCNYFYNSAFHHPFYAITAPSFCGFKAPASFPPNYRMGYVERRKGQVRGELFVKTQANAPWNVVD